MTSTAYVAAYDDLADWEIGHLLAELHSGRFTGEAWEVRTFAETSDPITTMGGVRVLPDLTIDQVEPTSAGLLVLPGASLYDTGDGARFADLAGRFLTASVPVAAICGATAGLARAGLLDSRRHTSAAPEYLAATGYAGGAHYVDERAVVDGDLVTAGPQSPIHFAIATLRRLGLVSEPVLEAYEGVFHRGDRASYPALMQAAG